MGTMVKSFIKIQMSTTISFKVMYMLMFKSTKLGAMENAFLK